MGKGTHSTRFRRERATRETHKGASNLTIPRGFVLTENVFRTIPRPVIGKPRVVVPEAVSHCGVPVGKLRQGA